MSYKTSLVKLAINKTPRRAIKWVVNKKLKGVAKLNKFSFNSDDKKLYAEVLLEGEEEAIEIWLEDFSLITTEQEQYKLVIQKVQSNKPWLNTLLNKAILGRRFDIPESQSQLVWELFADHVEDDSDDEYE